MMKNLALMDTWPLAGMSRTFRAWRANRLGRLFDEKYGTDTQTLVSVDDLGIGANAAEHAVHYEPSSIPKFERAMRNMHFGLGDYTFIDVGSGKGLVALLAARRPFRKVVGIEISADLHAIALANLELFRQRETLRAPIEFMHGNVLDCTIPYVNGIYYLYNPFDEVILRQLVRLIRDARPGGGDTIIVYVNPVHLHVIRSAEWTLLYSDRTLAILRSPDSDLAP